jgi:hypothetical protein
VGNFCPTIVRVVPENLSGESSGDLVSLEALWTMMSGEQYEVRVRLLSHFACASLVVLLCAGDIGPLALLALAQPI